MRKYTITEARALADCLEEAQQDGYTGVAAAAYALAGLLHAGYELRRFEERCVVRYGDLIPLDEDE